MVGKTPAVAASDAGGAPANGARGGDAVVAQQPRAAEQGNAGGVAGRPGGNQPPEDEEPQEEACCSVYCCRMVCWFFCCPPLPSRIVAKQAFLPPDPPAYLIDEVGGVLKIQVEVEGSDPPTMVAVQASQRNGTVLSVHKIPNGSNRVLAAHYVKLPNARYTLLFSHGNAVDIGQLLPYMLDLSQRIGCSIVSYDYSGYGLSSGKPREKNQYRDVAAVYRYMLTELGVPAREVILYGMSIGSSPTVHLAAKLCKRNARAESRGTPPGPRSPDPPPAGVVLHAPVASGIRVLRPACTHTICCDPFQNLHKVPRITLPALVIHGERDDVVPVSHGKMLHAGLPQPVTPLWLRKANHNNVEAFNEYYDRLRTFLDELDTHAAAAAAAAGAAPTDAGGGSP